MPTSVNVVPFARTYSPTTALAKGVDFTDDSMVVSLMDGRVLSVPIPWSPLLFAATPEQRANVEIAGGGISLHWPDIDEDLSVAGLLRGVATAPTKSR